jgi:hypothetical protein
MAALIPIAFRIVALAATTLFAIALLKRGSNREDLREEIGINPLNELFDLAINPPNKPC